jgi:hypothetical protein
MDAFRTLIVPDSEVDFAREVAASFGPGGTGMWTTALSSSGSNPPAYYISTGYISEEFAFMLPLQVWGHDREGNWVMVSSYPGDPVALYNAVIANGVVCTQAEVDALFAASDVTEQDPFTAMGRLGVQIISPPMET